MDRKYVQMQSVSASRCIGRWMCVGSVHRQKRPPHGRRSAQDGTDTPLRIMASLATGSRGRETTARKRRTYPLTWHETAAAQAGVRERRMDRRKAFSSSSARDGGVTEGGGRRGEEEGHAEEEEEKKEEKKEDNKKE